MAAKIGSNGSQQSRKQFSVNSKSRGAQISPEENVCRGIVLHGLEISIWQC